MGGKAIIGEVGNSLGDGAKIARTVDPAHWQDQGKGHQRRFVGVGRQECTQGSDGVEVEPHPHEGVGNVGFRQIDGPSAGIGSSKAVEETGEGVTELEGVGGVRNGISIDAAVGVVDNGSVAAVTLGDNAGGGETEPREVGDQVKRDNQPVASSDHVGKFFAKEGST